jgi:hypothetical protein
MAANITMTGTPRLADPHAPVRFTATAGTAMTAGDGVYIHTDGKFYPIDKTVVTIANVSKWYGVIINTVVAGEAVTAFGIGAKIYMTDTVQTIGKFFYVSATVGKFYDAAVASADTYLPCLKFITAHVAEVVRGGI